MMRCRDLCAVLLVVGVGCAEESSSTPPPSTQDGSVVGFDGALPDVSRGDAAVSGLDGATMPPDASVTPADGFADRTPTGVDGWGPLPDGGCRVVQCQSHTYQCGDCMDNDGDGRMDWQDPDCLGPCDNSESGFDLAIPGGGSAPCRLDCYFDQDTGTGNDRCEWDHRCDPRQPSAPTCMYSSPPPPSASCPAQQSQACRDFCLPLVPNGCDCFGCCELPAGSGRTVFLGSEPLNGAPRCDPTTVNNPSSCRACTQVTSCLNRCERCEVCIGRPVPPAECFVPTPPPDAGARPDGGTIPGNDASTPPTDGGTTNTGQCLADIQPCGLPGQALCPTNYYCITGCCIRAPD
jgi:hypothetical protein